MWKRDGGDHVKYLGDILAPVMMSACLGVYDNIMEGSIFR